MATQYFSREHGYHEQLSTKRLPSVFFNVASETVYYDLFLFIRQKREKKIPPSAGQLLFVFRFIGNFQLKGPCLNFFTETTSFMKQSAFQYKIKRAFFGKKKKRGQHRCIES